MKKLLTFALLAMLTLPISLYAELPAGLQTYQLDNGLTVYLWEDHDQPDVAGWTITRAGSIDEPDEYTGLAHYLEHMLFKGTQTIGALDWEKEQPLYEDIIRLYDEYAATTDPKQRESIIQQINEKSLEAAQYTLTDDFSNLIESMGGEGLNAFTSYDQTCYFNNFPASQMEKWLTIYSDRLINPVFRSFQAELENVFEEFNMYQDNVSSHISNFLFSNIYQGHPYERDIIGTAEHLKNPRLSKLIEFYQTWYVPNNMALVLVGNFDAEATKPLIEKYFSRLQAKPLPERPQHEEVSFTGNPERTLKVGYYPQQVWAFKGVKQGDPDQLLLEFVVALLNNAMNTGLFDKLTLDGDITYASADCDVRRDQGRILIQAIPYYDIEQRQYESYRATKNLIFEQLQKLKDGDIEQWRINTVKEEYSQAYDMMLENPSSKPYLLMDVFIYNKSLEEAFLEKEKIMAITKDDVKRIAKKYFDTDYMSLNFEEGDPKKNKLAKPKIKPLDSPQGETEYAKNFKQLPIGQIEETFNNFADVEKVQVDDHITLYMTPNTKNNIFSLVLRYGIGTERKPLLEHAVELMNTAGIMPNQDAQSFRRELAALGGSCIYGVSDSYLTIQITGTDEHLKEISNLVQRQILMPKLDKKQLESVISSDLMNRFTQSKHDAIQASAMLQYILYGNESDYLDVVPFEDVYGLSIPKLITIFQDATQYDLEAYYCGNQSVEDVLASIPQKENMRPSTSPEIKERKEYAKTQIYLLPNTNVQQAKVYFYVQGDDYTIDQEVNYAAFNQYFSGGFSGLVMNEIREKRSMAYTAYGQLATPALPDYQSYFIGYVGTQSDKVADAVDVFMDLLQNMPAPETKELEEARMANIRTYLRQAELTAKPSMRGKAATFAYWQKIGYTDDPAKANLAKIDALQYADIQAFYEQHLKGKPVTIVIMGDPKLINQKALQAKYGKIQKLTKGKLFAPLDLDF